MLHSVIAASARFRLLLVALAAGIAAIAVTWLPGMHADVLPETSPVVVRIQTEAPGLSAPEVESLVTVPLEKNLLEGVMNVTDVTSDSIAGLSQIELDFAPGTNLYQARQLVQERLTQAFVLPNVSKPPVMLQPVSSTGNVMLIGLTSRQLSLIDLSVLARWTIVPRLLGVPGVADVSTFGEADRQLQVLVDPARLAARHITLAQIIETAGNAQLVSPLSYLEGSTPGTGGFLEGPDQRLTIQPVLPFGTPANLGQVPVAETTGKAPVPLGSVTDIVVGHQPLIGDALVRGQPGLVLVVQKLPSASVPAVTNGLDQALAQLQPSLSGVQVDTSLFRPASYLDSALHNLKVALIAAAILAALALIALLLDLRLVAIALIATGMSLLAGILVLYLLGYTFNALVTLGLLLALAIVVAEGVGTAHRLMIRLRAEAPGGSRPSGVSLVIEACSELRGPLCTATLAVLVAAVPVALISGLTGTFLRPMVLAFMFAVAASTVVALTLTPALAALLLGGDRRVGRGRWARRALAARLGTAYGATLRLAVRMPRLIPALLCVAGIGALVAFLPAMHPAQPQFQDRNLVIRWTGAPGMSLPELDRLAARTSQELAALPAVSDVAATRGPGGLVRSDRRHQLGRDLGHDQARRRLRHRRRPGAHDRRRRARNSRHREHLRIRQLGRRAGRGARRPHRPAVRVRLRRAGPAGAAGRGGHVTDRRAAVAADAAAGRAADAERHGQPGGHDQGRPHAGRRPPRGGHLAVRPDRGKLLRAAEGIRRRRDGHARRCAAA